MTKAEKSISKQAHLQLCCHSKASRSLKYGLWPFVGGIHPRSKDFVRGVENNATGDWKLNDIPRNDAVLKTEEVSAACLV